MTRFMMLALAACAVVALVCQPALARERVHYIAAVELTWNYAPTGQNVITGKPLRPLLPAQLGWSYRKAAYREYTDESFSTPLPIAPAERYRGLVGPTIYAEAGDTIVVHFKNMTTLPMDIAPSGLPSLPQPASVRPGGTQTFRWPVSVNAGPGSHDESSILYTYASDVRQSGDENAGLIGPLVITRRGTARIDGSPEDVDQDIVTLFSVQMESMNPLLSASLGDPKLNPRRLKPSAKTFVLDNAFASINGFVYGNMPMPSLRQGERVRWYLLSTQNFTDGHIPTWAGQTVLSQGNRADAIALPTHHAIVDMVPDNPGAWLLKCSLNVHLEFGMEARFVVRPSSQ
jgi:hephaestin